MAVQELEAKPATGHPVTVLRENASSLTGLIFVFFVCTLVLLSIVLNTLSHLEARMANIEGQMAELQSPSMNHKSPTGNR